MTLCYILVKYIIDYSF